MNLSKKNTEMLSMIGHDIKSPLNGILGFAQLLSEEIENDEHRKMAFHIQKAGEHILYLVNNILTMVKLEAGKELPDFKWVHSLEDELREALQIFMLEARAKNISLELIIEEPLSRVFWDMEKLRLHVFNNILSNALKFTAPGGFIEITAAQKNELIEITIRDSGPGIPLYFREKIFEPYCQVDASSGLRSREGLGLGLYNARKFVEYHGGSINLDSGKSHDLLDEYILEENVPLEYLTGAKFIIQLPVFPEKIYSSEKLSGLKISEKMKKSMMPSFMELPGLDIAASCIRGNAGKGDWYDVFQITERYALISMGDTAGKGSLVNNMDTVISLLKGIAISLTNMEILHSVNAPQPDEILRLANNVLVNHPFTSFATIFLGVIDLFKHTLTYVSCGQEPALLYRNDAVVSLGSGGGPLGVYPEKTFFPMLEKHTLELIPDDAIVIYCDAMSDSFQKKNTSMEKLLTEWMKDSCNKKDSESMKGQFVEKLQKNSLEQNDDMTIMVIRVP